MRKALLGLLGLALATLGAGLGRVGLFGGDMDLAGAGALSVGLVVVAKAADVL